MGEFLPNSTAANGHPAVTIAEVRLAIMKTLILIILVQLALEGLSPHQSERRAGPVGKGRSGARLGKISGPAGTRRSGPAGNRKSGPIYSNTYLISVLMYSLTLSLIPSKYNSSRLPTRIRNHPDYGCPPAFASFHDGQPNRMLGCPSWKLAKAGGQPK